MKHLKAITFALTFAACSAVNAMADENEFQAPDVSNKLDHLVEVKMDALVKETYDRRGYYQIVEYTPEGKVIQETAIRKALTHDVEENRS